MKLDFLKHIVIVFLFVGCQNQPNNHIDKFEKILGENETVALNLLVSDFEDNLEKVYPDLSLQLAYEQYLKDLIDVKESNWKKFDFQTDKTHNAFINSGLRDEIYLTSKVYDSVKKDSITINDVNRTGKHMQALNAIKESDSLISTYWDNREAAGLMQNELSVNGILNLNPDFSNYFHKRIVVVEYSF